jgi:CBS domain-containing protein
MTLTFKRGLRTDPVSSLPQRPFAAAAPDDSIHHAVEAMRDQHAGCVLILSDSKLVGIFTERDFISRVIAKDLDVLLPVERVMTPSPVTLRCSSSVLSAVELMDQAAVNHLPVVDDDNRPSSVLSSRDVVHYLVEYFPAKVYNLPDNPEQKQPVREGA